MNLTSRGTRIVPTALAALTLTALGGGIATAAPTSTPSTAEAASSVTETFYTPNDGTYLHTKYQCPNDSYLELDSTSNNSSQIFRRATYNTGDNTPLDFTEYAIPYLGPTGAFSEVDIYVQLASSGRAPFEGHKSFSIHCAPTLEAAHQK